MWPKAPLGEVADVVSGATPKTGEPRYWDGPIPWVTPADLSHLNGPYITKTPRMLTDDGLSSCSANLLPPGSVLLSSRAPIGHVAINTVPMATNQGFKSFVPDRNLLDEKFLYWWLVSNKAFLQRLGVGATFKEVSKSIVSRIEVPLPPLPEQRRIAFILDQAASIAIAVDGRQSHLTHLVESQFHHCTGSADLVKYRLGEIAEIVGGSTPKSGVASYWDGDIPWITPADLSRRSEVVVNSTSRTISTEGLKSIGGRLIPVGSVLLSSRAPIGLVGLVGVPMATNQGFKSLVVNRALVDATFLYWWLKLNRALLESRGVGATFKEMSKSIVESIPVELPLLGIQKKFAREAESIEKLRLQAVSVSARANELLESLKSRAFKGEL